MRDPVDHLGIALDHLVVVESYRQRLDHDDPLPFDAICMRLMAAIEAASRVPTAWLVAEFGDAWPAMKSTRNVIAHAYDDVDEVMVRAAVERDLPVFTAGLHRLIDRHAPGLEPELP